MARIEIKNIGPIKEAKFDLNKVNVFMGPQSSGKSTIAKIISYCQWVEKRFILDRQEDCYHAEEQLLEFHRLNKNYFYDDSFFKYESEFVIITCEGKDLKQFIKEKNGITHYSKTKNIYIPSERNFVAVIPNLRKYNETNDNVMSFLRDYYVAKRKYKRENTLPILGLGVSFYNNENDDSDILVLEKEKKEISLHAGSSGLQSITPLLLVLEYLSNILYTEKVTLSIDEQESLDEFMRKSYPELNGIDFSHLEQYNTKPIDWKMTANLRISYHYTNFIIEEPEQNLFPETQKELIYHLLKSIQQKERHHSLLITTHSPYILYALNNCMMGWLVYDKMSDKDKQKLKCQSSLINPQDVSVYEIHDGILIKIQQDDNLIGANYFDKKMKELMDDFYVMLNYYE